MFKIFDKMLSSMLLAAILIYQKILSPDSGLLRCFFPQGVCRFYPHCSQYGYQAIRKYGSFKGGALAAWRICRCHPWSDGGHDPLL